MGPPLRYGDRTETLERIRLAEKAVGMSGSSEERIDAITLFDEDLERSKIFYQKAFGMSVLFEDEDSAVFRFENTLFR